MPKTEPRARHSGMPEPFLGKDHPNVAVCAVKIQMPHPVRGDKATAVHDALEAILDAVPSAEIVVTFLVNA